MYPISSCSSRGLFIFLPGKGEGQRGEGTLRSFCKNLPPKKTKQKKKLHNIVEFNIDFDYFYHNPDGEETLRLLGASGNSEKQPI